MVCSWICDNQARIWLARFIAVSLALLGLSVVSGCEDDPGAPPPGAFSRVSTPTPAEADTVDDSAFAGLGDFEFSAQPLPPAERVFFAFGDDLWKLPESGDAEVIAEDLQITSYSASASGDVLAILSLEHDDDDRERTELSIIRADGTRLFELSDLSSEFDLGAFSAIESIAVTPSGSSLAMTHPNGAMTLVSLAGDIHQLLQPSTAHSPGRLSWSADGQFLAYLDPWMPNQPSALYVHIPARDLRDAMVKPGADGHGVIRARWIPGTSHVVYVKASGSTIPHGGDMFLIDAQTGRQELLMSSGEIAPVGGVVDIATSPDGTWLAATGYVPGDDAPRFAGLWLTNLQSGIRTEIEIEDGGPVTDLWWLGEELLVRVIDEARTSLPGTYTGRESFRLFAINPQTGRVTERFSSQDEESSS